MHISIFEFLYCVGCILAELYTGLPLFPGENEVEQLACIIEIIGLPPCEVLARASRRKLFFGNYQEGFNDEFMHFFARKTNQHFITDAKGAPRYSMNSVQWKRKPGSRNLTSALQCDDPLFIDFISRCLE